MDSSLPTTSATATSADDQQPQLSREQMVELLHAEMRRRSGQDQESYSFPENPMRDPTDPDDQDDYDRHRIGHTCWCKCNNCVPMPTGIESICCCEISNVQTVMEDLPCVLDHPMMPQLCGNEDWARIFLFLSNGFTRINPADSNINRSYRKAVYRAFTAWVHGVLGRRDRRPIPACVVTKVREAFPDPVGVYMGYREHRDGAAEHMVTE